MKIINGILRFMLNEYNNCLIKEQEMLDYTKLWLKIKNFPINIYQIYY